MCAEQSEWDICYVLSDWGGPFKWECWGLWLMSHIAESPCGPISSYSLYYCHSRQQRRRSAPPPQPSVTCPVCEMTSGDEWIEGCASQMNQRHAVSLIQPSTLVKLLPFPVVRIWHSSKSISAFVFTVASVPVLSHNNPLKINKKKNTMGLGENIYMTQHDMIFCTVLCAAGSVLCLARMVQMQDFITSLFSWVSNDIGLFYRCNLDKIWITTQMVLQRSV